tara:strand:- start:699 stop:956 length:258 start_codon:yes stop_codon:yes gene_type:complete
MKNQNETVASKYERLRWKCPDTGKTRMHIILVSKETEDFILFTRHNREGEQVHEKGTDNHYLLHRGLIISRTPLHQNLFYGTLSS